MNRRPPVIDWDGYPQWMTVHMAAMVLRVHPNTLRSWDRKGYLRAVRIGSRQDRRYPKENVRGLYERQRTPFLAAEKASGVFALHPQKLKRAFALFAAAFVVAVIAFTMQLPAHADVIASREYRLRPQTCEGWQNANNATAIQLPPIATGGDFSASNAAFFHGDEQAVTTNGKSSDVITGSLDQQRDATITCAHFSAESLPNDGELVDAKITLSFSVVTAQNSTDAFLVEGSTNGQDWFPIAMFPDRERSGSYNIIPLNQLVHAQQFADLSIRIRADAASYSADTQAALDGIEIVATIARAASATRSVKTSGYNSKRLDALVSFSQEVYQTSEQPVVIVPKKRVKKFLFFAHGEESWTLQKVTLTDTHGDVAAADYHTQDAVSGQSTNTTVTLDTAKLHPGRYTVAVMMTSPAGTAETVKKDFVWGVIALNATIAAPRQFDTQEVALGVLDDAGKTICNADAALTVTDPKGKTRRFATRDATIKTSGACVDKGVTNMPDYAAKFVLEESGLYHLRLVAKTAFGIRETEQNFTVDTANSFIVHRVNFPTRINPTSSYTARIAVTPLLDYTGIVTERVPADIAVSAFQPEASVHTLADNVNIRTIEWPVAWQAGRTYFLEYSFDAPDVSPALFTLGPFSIGGSFVEDPLFREPRQWQLASDSVKSQQQAVPTADMKKEKDRFVALASFEKVQYRVDEKPVLKVPKQHKREGLLTQGNDIWAVKNVEVRGPHGEITKAESHEQDVAVGSDTDSALIIDTNAFHPGKNTVVMDVTMPDGSEQSVEKDVIWGVLVVNPEKSIYLPGETAVFDMAVLDNTGKTLCQADLQLTVTSPGGVSTVLSTSNGTIVKNYNCDVHSVSNTPDYSGQMVVNEVGTYQMHLESTIKEGQERTDGDQVYSIDDSFTVQQNVPFDISRHDTATRIYPVIDYTTHLTIIANQDYRGTVSEYLPTSFQAYDISNGGLAAPSPDSNRQQIDWQVDWHAGNTYALAYTYHPPAVSPRLYPLGPLAIGTFQEVRQWQIAADATRVWDGGDSTANWSAAANWDGDNALASGDTVVFDGSAGGTPNDAATWDASAPASIASLTVTSHSGTMTITGVSSTATVTGAFSHTSTGAFTITSGTTLAVGGNYTMTTSGTVTTTGSTLSLTGTGTGNTFNSGATYETLNYSPASSGTYTISTNAPTMTNTLTIGANGTLTISVTAQTACANSSCLTLQNKAGNGLTLSGTIDGTGTFTYTNQKSPAAAITFPSTGTMSANLVLVPISQNITVAGATTRTFGGNVTIYQPAAATTCRTVTFGSAASQTFAFSGNIVVENESTTDATCTLTLAASATNNPAMTITGNVSFTHTINGACSSPPCNQERITMGGSTWTVSGNFQPYNAPDDNGILTGTSATLVMNGTSKTFSPPTSSTIKNLTISGTVTVNSYGPSVSTNLTIDANKTLTVDTIQLTLSTTVTTISISGELDTTNGGNILTQTTTSMGTGGTINANVTFCPGVGATMPVPARTFSGTDKTIKLDACSASGAATTQVTAGTFTLAGNLELRASFGASGPSIADFDTYDPVVAITGNVSVSTGSTTLSMGTGGWTVGGNFDLTNLDTLNNNSGTLTMNGASGVLTSNSKTLNNFVVSGGSISTADTAAIAGTLTVSAGTFTLGNAAITVTGTTSITGTINTATGNTGTRAFTGAVTINSGGTWNMTGQNPSTSFTNGITVSTGATSFNNGTGNTTFLTNASNFQALAGTVNMTFGGTATIDAGVTLRNNNTGTVQFATITGGDANSTLSLSPDTANSYTKVTAAPMATGKIIPSATNANTFDYNYATATVKVPTTNNYYHLVLSSTGTVTMTSITGTTGDLTLSGSNTVTTSTSTFIVGGNLTVGTGTTFHMGDVANTVTGATSVTGTLDTATGSTGTRTFTGNVTINSGGSWDLTGQNPSTSFAGDITVSTGAVKFDNGTGGATWTASKQLAGAVNMTFGGTNTINAGITLTNNNTGTVQFATIAGGDATSSLATGASTTTKVSGAAMTTGTIVPSTSSNIFEYNGAGQTVKAPTTNPYYDLNLSGSGTVTMPASGLTAISGTLAISGTASVTTASTLTITGDATVATGATFTINHDVAVNGGDITNAGTGSITTSAGTPTVTVSGTGSIGGVSGSTTFYNLTLSGTPTLASNIQVNNNLTLPATVTAGSTTITMAGTSGTLVGGGSTIYALTINPSSAGTIALNTSDLTVSNTLTVALDDALTINANRTLTLSGSSGTTLSLSGTINGPGRLTYQSTTTFPTGGTLAATLITRFDTKNGNMNIPARIDYGAIEAFGDSANARVVTLGTAGGQTVTTSSSFYVIADAGAGNNVTIQGATWDPTLNVGTDFDFTGSGAATEIVTAPDATATWTVGGNVDLTGGTYTASAETLVMNGSSKTLTSAGNTLFNVTLSGTITLANATHTISGDLSLAGGTITAGSSTILMTGSKNLIGGSNTLNNLTIGDGTDTVTLTTSDLTVSGTLTTANAGDTLSLGANRTLTHTGAALTNNGTISGAGTLRFTDASGGPGTGGTLSSIVRYDASAGNVAATTVDARTYGGAVEFYSNVAAIRSITFPAGTLTFSSTVTVITGTSQSSVLTVDASNGDTSNPTVNITGVLAYTKGGSATPAITSGTGTWTVSSSVTLTNGTFTATSGNTLVMSGTGTLTSNSNVLQNITLSGSITLADETHTVAGNFSMAGGTMTAGTSTIAMTGTSKTIDGGGNTLNNLTISGTEALQNTDLTVNTLLTVDNTKSLTLNANRTLTLSGSSGTTLSLSGTINGPGRLTYQSTTTFPTGGTLAATLITRFDTVNGNMVVPARTDYGALEAYGGSANARTVTLGTVGGQTVTTSSYFYVIADAGAGNNVTIQGATYDPTLNVGGDFDFTGTGSANEIVTAPDAAATWTVTGNVDLSNGTWTAGAETLLMNGSTNLVGNSQTIANFTVNGTNNTVTVATSDVVVSGVLTIGAAADSDNDTLSIAADRTVTSGVAGTVTFVASGTDTISGSGTLAVKNSNLDTDGVLSSVVRFDATGGNITMPARTYGGLVEVYSNATDAGKTVAMGAGTHTLSGALNLLAANTQNITLDGATNDPTLNLSGDVDFTGGGAGSEVMTAPDTGSVTWTVSGSADFTGGTYTKGAETLVMNGATKTITSNSNTLNNFEVSAGSVTMVGTTTVAGNLTVSGGTLSAPSSGALNVAGNWNNSGGTFTDNSSTVTFNGLSQQTAQGTMTESSDFNNLIITNASGSDPDTSPSVIFSAAATVSGTFTATTADTKLRFNAGSTYTFVNVTLNGQATGTRVALRSSTGGTVWNVNVAGTRSVSNTDVKDSNACGQTPDIDASDGTNKDSGNNPCWAIAYLTVSLSPTTSVDLGTLDLANVNQASLTSTVSTTAASGFVSTVLYDVTLTSGSNTIPDATGGTIAPGGSEFGASTDDTTSVDLSTTSNSCATGTGTYNATGLSATAQTFASEAVPATSDVTTLCFSAGISATQAPGSYTSTVTLVTTGKF